MMSGDIPTWRRSRRPDSRKLAMVRPPPSIRTRRRPRAASAARMSAGAIQPSRAGSVTVSTPFEAVRPAGLDHDAPRPSSAKRGGRVGEAARAGR
jgi:hypothetical protein